MIFNGSPAFSGTRFATRQDHQVRLGRALNLIRSNANGPFAPSILAKSACYSAGHFYEVFTKLIGEPVASLMRRRRLDAAAFQLVTTRKTVTEIAFANGFESHSAFTRAFRRQFKMSPTGFRTGPGSLPRAERGARLAIALAEFLQRNKTTSLS